MLLMLLVSLASVNAKCDWSKVSLGKSNTCNAYKFEVTGTVDTCYKHDIKIYKKGATTTTYAGTNRVFSYTFNDTGYYYVRVSVKNACCGGDTLIYVLIHVECKPTTKPKCDWSKVSLVKSNTCNVYKFEVTGTADTCNKHSILIVKKGVTTPSYTGDNRVFNYTFNDTGYYFVKVSIKNKCCGGDTLFYDYIHVTCKPTTKPKCDWSKVKPGYSYSGRSYKFEISSIDTCLTYTNLRYGKGKVDTLNHDRTFGVTFSDTGIWYIISKIHNKCTGCDTSFYIRLHVVGVATKKCDWSKIGLGYSNRCGTVTFELGSRDTCITGYSLWAYNHATHKLDTLAHDRIFRRTLDTGWYTFKASFHNKCGNCDTFIYKEIHIGCDSTMVGLKTISRDVIKVTPNPADDRVLVCLTSPTKQPLVPYFIYNGSGQIVKDGLISSCVQINTSSWKSGIYTFRMGSLTHRIVVQH